jgi:hypothetical protein
MAVGALKRVWRRVASPLLVLSDQSNESLAAMKRIEDQLGVVNHRISHLEQQNAELDRALEVLMATRIANQRETGKALTGVGPNRIVEVRPNDLDK